MNDLISYLPLIVSAIFLTCILIGTLYDTKISRMLHAEGSSIKSVAFIIIANGPVAMTMRCVESIQEHHADDYDILIADNNGSDNPRSYRSMLKNEERVTYYRARNTLAESELIKRVRSKTKNSDYVCIVDSFCTVNDRSLRGIDRAISSNRDLIIKLHLTPIFSTSLTSVIELMIDSWTDLQTKLRFVLKQNQNQMYKVGYLIPRNIFALKSVDVENAYISEVAIQRNTKFHISEHIIKFNVQKFVRLMFEFGVAALLFALIMAAIQGDMLELFIMLWFLCAIMITTLIILNPVSVIRSSISVIFTISFLPILMVIAYVFKRVQSQSL